MTRWAKHVRPDKVHPEYPRPQMVREKWQNLNGLWQFAEDKGEAPPIGKNLDGRILVPFPVESALSGVGQRMERLWYRGNFTVPQDWAGRRVLLHFGAVDWEAKVWLNGRELGEHRGGYDNFSFDLTDHLKKDGEQELIVGVFDPSDAGTQPCGKQVRKPEGIWYTPSTGIWQTVWLEPVPYWGVKSVRITPRGTEPAKQYDLELRRMIDQLRNHPCIVMWVPFNEGRRASASFFLLMAAEVGTDPRRRQRCGGAALLPAARAGGEQGWKWWNNPASTRLQS